MAREGSCSGFGEIPGGSPNSSHHHKGKEQPWWGFMLGKFTGVKRMERSGGFVSHVGLWFK